LSYPNSTSFSLVPPMSCLVSDRPMSCMLVTFVPGAY
jgi:hypothetical protein